MFILSIVQPLCLGVYDSTPAEEHTLIAPERHCEIKVHVERRRGMDVLFLGSYGMDSSFMLGSEDSS
jgi:hypothetical protein